ncbi:SHOCT domain-containing protein [Microbacterium sp. SORGH_AS_0888]|uniref:SHOCT domain-containing protein n=1 Tax=Microbacterium sp. SORGH_AS_0888 TaxID=3041791 RepID=UPI0027D84446|nr:SHOCT domain-containing protein [Microbacterium sp. SORGH_AS_0888]
MSTGAPAGWYPNGDYETYWDGSQWTDQHRPKTDAGDEEPEATNLRLGDGRSAPLLDFVSHIAGKNARVFVWPDRIEWQWRGRLGAGAKAGLAVMTLGVSYAKTGFTRKQSSEIIPIRSITSVTSKKGKGFQTIVQVITAGNTIDMRIGHAEAEQIKSTLMQLVNGSYQPPVHVSSPTPTVAPAVPQPDYVGQLQQLATLRDAGILTEDEFAAKKAEILARM